MTQTLVDEGSTVALFGFGITGRAVTAALLERKASVIVFDDSPSEEMAGIAQAMGAVSYTHLTLPTTPYV